MRKDEHGEPCPATLGEYRDTIFAITGESKATEYLDAKIAIEGRDARVLAADSQMRALLLPMMFDSGMLRELYMAMKDMKEI